MKWFKHFSDARHDEFITWLRAEYGMEGVGRWWTILEVVAEQMEPKEGICSAKHPWVEWCSFLKQKRNKLSLFLKQIENKSKIKTTDYGNVLEIEIPKMLKLRDNYHRNLQGTDKNEGDGLASPRARLSSTSSSIQEELNIHIDTKGFTHAPNPTDNPFGQGINPDTGEAIQ